MRKTLSTYHWDARNMDALEHICAYLTAWFNFSLWFRGFTLGELERPDPILILWGPMDSGKTHLMKAIENWFTDSLFIPESDIMYLVFPSYVIESLEDVNEYFSWDKPRVMLIDDIDRSRNPIPHSLSTWLVATVASQIKSRCMSGKAKPTIICSNMSPADEQFLDHFSSSSSGGRSTYTEEAGRQFVTVLGRRNHAFKHKGKNTVFIPRIPASEVLPPDKAIINNASNAHLQQLKRLTDKIINKEDK